MYTVHYVVVQFCAVVNIVLQILFIFCFNPAYNWWWRCSYMYIVDGGVCRPIIQHIVCLCTVYVLCKA